MNTRRAALLLGGGAVLILGLALWLAASIHARPAVDDGPIEFTSETAREPVLPAPAPRPSGAAPEPAPTRVAPPPVGSVSEEERAALQQRMIQLQSEASAVVQDIHRQLATGRSPEELLPRVQAAREQFRQRLGTESTEGRAAEETFSELEQQLRLRARARPPAPLQ